MQIALTITSDDPAELHSVLQAVQTALRVEMVVAPVAPAPVEKAAQNGAAPSKQQQQSTAQEAPVEEPKRTGGRPRKTVLAPRTDIPKDQPVYAAKPELKVVEKPEKPEEKEPEVTMAMVRNALTKFLAANTEVAATALLKKFGHTDRLSQLKVEYFPAVYAAAVTPVVSDAPSIFNDDISDVGA